MNPTEWTVRSLKHVCEIVGREKWSQEAKAYARSGFIMACCPEKYDQEALRAQAEYIRSNLSTARGPWATPVREWLDEYIGAV